jgi:hypothetical protein
VFWLLPPPPPPPELAACVTALTDWSKMKARSGAMPGCRRNSPRSRPDTSVATAAAVVSAVVTGGQGEVVLGNADWPLIPPSRFLILDDKKEVEDVLLLPR